MADRFYGYQYDTTPRKLNSDYAPYKKGYPKKDEPVTTNRSRSKNKRKKTIGAEDIKSKKRDTLQNNAQKKQVPKNVGKQVGIKQNKEQVDVPKTNAGNQKKNTEDSTQKVKSTKESVKAKLKIVAFLVTGFSVLFAISYQNSLISESFNKKEQYKKEMEALRKTNQQIEVSIENNLNLNYIEQAAKDRLGMQKLNNEQKIYVSLPKEDYVAPAAEQIVIEDNMSFFERLFKNIWK